MNPSGATSAARFLPRSSEVAAAVGPGPLRHVESTGSTNADLVAEARNGDASGAVLVTDHQTAGRGRLDRVWDDVPGDSLLVSLRLPAAGLDPSTVVRALGAAARSAVDDMCRDRVLAKWPNDLVVTDGPHPGKLSGVLAEYVAGTDTVVVGIGINIRPISRQEHATSIVECGGPDDRDALLAAILQGLAARLGDPAAVIEELRAHSATLGTRVRVELPDGGAVQGEAVELAAGGELVVRDDDGRDHTIATGDVVHLRGV